MDAVVRASRNGYNVLTFYLAIAAMIVVALACVLPRLLSGRSSDAGTSRSALNVQVYRGQIADLERERDTGALTAAEYDCGRAELERRLLVEAAPDAIAASRPRARSLAIAVVLVLPIAAFALYLLFGNLRAIAVTPDESATAGNPAAYRMQLLAHLSGKPRDGRAWVALARLDMDEDRFADAVQHYAKAIEASAKVARDPGVLCEYADALGMAQGGRLEGPPAATIDRALALDPAHPKALEMAGSVAYERRDYPAAVRHWRALLDRFPAGTPAHVELAAAIDRAERLAATALPPAAGTRGG